MSTKTTGLLTCALIAALSGGSSAQWTRAARPVRPVDARPERVVVAFRTTYVPATSAHAAFVLGDVPELGGGDVTRAIPMVAGSTVAGSNGEWRVSVELPADRRVSYRFFERDATRQALALRANGAPLSEVRFVGPSFDVSVRTKTLFVHSDFEAPVLFWRQEAEGEFQAHALEHLGPAHGSRFDGRELWAAREIGLAGRRLEFFVRNRSGARRDPQSGTYLTPLDRALLQDGELYTYLPAPAVAPARRDYVKSKPPRFDSKLLGEKRRYRVFLPRGYDQHVRRRYPVLYLYDGQLIWENASHWDQNLEGTSDLVAAGEVSEAILVAVDSPRLAEGRSADTTPPDDIEPLTGLAGSADVFLRFLLEELKPRIDATYRTLPDREHTFFQGFSLGGVLALYAGWDFFEHFEAVACQSPALDQSPRFLKRLRRAPKRPVRLYLDVGLLEGNAFVRKLRALVAHLGGETPPWIWSGDLELRLGFGQTHSYPNAGKRKREVLTWLLPATTERDPRLWRRK